MPDDPKPPASYPSPTTKIPPTILPALTSVLVIFIGIVATQLKLDMTPANVAILGGSSATLIVAYIQYKKCKVAEAGRFIAESRISGISTENGPKASRTTITNDPNSSAPPVITEHSDPQ